MKGQKVKIIKKNADNINAKTIDTINGNETQNIYSSR